MLSIAKVQKGREGYYLGVTALGRLGGPNALLSPTSKISTAIDSGLIEPDGQWQGRGAAFFDLDGLTVSPRAMSALFSGSDPHSTEVLNERHTRVRIGGYDCTFAPPKSVSILHALAADEISRQVRISHENAVSAVVDYLDRNTAEVRRQHNHQRYVTKATGLATATFVHRTSRSNDPHLHTHAVIANIARDQTGIWSALDARALYRHLRAANMAYGAHLRHELVTRLGVRFIGTSPYADLAGMDRKVIDAFSQRKAQIDRELAITGHDGKWASRLAAARTRPDKDNSLPYDDLVQQWRQRAYELGVSDGHLSAVVHRTGRVTSFGRFGDVNEPNSPQLSLVKAMSNVEISQVVENTQAKARQTCESRLPTGHAIFARRDLVAGICASEVNGITVAQAELLAKEMIATSEVITINHDGGGDQPGVLGQDVREATFTTKRWLDLKHVLDPMLQGDDSADLAKAIDTASRQDNSLILTTGSRRAIHLEGLFGIEAIAIPSGQSAKSDLKDILNDAGPSMNIIVEWTDALGPDAAETLLECAHLGKATITLVRYGALDQLIGNDITSRLNSETRDHVVKTNSKMIEEVEVITGPSRADLIRELVERANTTMLEGKSKGNAIKPYIVVASKKVCEMLNVGLCEVFGEEAPKAIVSGSLAAKGQGIEDNQAPLLVLGKAGILGRSLDLVDGHRRVHFVLAPDLGHKKEIPGWFDEVAGPTSLRKVLGPLATDRAKRIAWRDGAVVARGIDGQARADLQPDIASIVQRRQRRMLGSPGLSR